MIKEISPQTKLTLKAIRLTSDIMLLRIFAELYYDGFDDGIRIGERNKHPIHNIEVKNYEFSNKKIE